MSAEDLALALRQSGRLSHTPTDADLTGSHPFGGTDLGLVARVWYEPSMASDVVRAEEFGVEVVEVIELGESWIIGANLRQWDDDALALFFRNLATGASTGDKVATHSAASSRRSGALGSDRAVKLVFAPRDVAHKGAIFYRAVPMVEETTRLHQTVTREHVFPVMFRALRDANGKTYEVGSLADLSVT